MLPVLSRFVTSSMRRAFATSAPDLSQLIRFRSIDGEEYFGVYSSVNETEARIAERVDGRLKITDKLKPVDVVLPPVDPPAIFCIGLNYADHAAEVKMPVPTSPVVFSKSVNALTGHNTAIIIPAIARDPPEVDYEAELAVIIGRTAKNVSAASAMDYILGYTIANDVTARRWQGKRGGGQWVRSKSFDTFLPLGPFLVPRAAVADVHDLKIRTWVNQDLVQDSNTSQMIVKVPQLIEFLSQGTTLFPGTVILTGTPAGVGYTRNVYLKPGDVVRVSIDKLGTLHNIVASEGASDSTDV